MRVINRSSFFIIFKLSVLLALLTLLLLGGETKNISQDVRLKDGLIYNKGQEKPFTGKILDTLNQTIISYDVIDGIKNGEFCLYTLSGVPYIKGFMKNNKNEGKWVYLYQNGNVESEGDFKNDVPHGKWKWYFPNGAIKSQGYYVNGKQVGTWKKYNKDGDLIKLTYYYLGKKIREVEIKKLKSV